MRSSIFDKPIFRARVNKEKAKIFPEGALGYLLGPILDLVSNSFIAAYLQKYYTDVLGLTTWAPYFLVVLQLGSVAFIVIGNIIVGKIMNKLNSKAGRARPLLLISFPLVVLAFAVMFWLTPYPDVNAGEKANFGVLIMIALGYNLYFSVGYPFYYASHSALVGLSTRDSKARGLLATLSNGAVLASMGACTMVIPLLLGNFFKEPVKAFAIFKWVALVLVIITVLGTILEFIFTRERVTEEQLEIEGGKAEEVKVVKTSEQWKICAKDKFWWIMIAFFFFYQLGGMLKNCSQLYYCNSLWGVGETTIQGINDVGGKYMSGISVAGAIPTAVGMLIVWPLSNKIGKGKLILFGALLAVAGGVMGILAGNNYVLVLIAFILKALGGAPAMYISLALLADISDHQEAKHGIRCDGLSMAIYGAIMVAMTGIANAIIAGVLSATGYDPTNAVEATAAASMTSSNVQTAMTWIFFGGEGICFLVIALMFIFMKVEKFSKEDQAILKARKGEAEEEQPAEQEAPAEEAAPEEKAEEQPAEENAEEAPAEEEQPAEEQAEEPAPEAEENAEPAEEPKEEASAEEPKPEEKPAEEPKEAPKPKKSGKGKGKKQ